MAYFRLCILEDVRACMADKVESIVKAGNQENVLELRTFIGYYGYYVGYYGAFIPNTMKVDNRVRPGTGLC